MKSSPVSPLSLFIMAQAQGRVKRLRFRESLSLHQNQNDDQDDDDQDLDVDLVPSHATPSKLIKEISWKELLLQPPPLRYELSKAYEFLLSYDPNTSVPPSCAFNVLSFEELCVIQSLEVQENLQAIFLQSRPPVDDQQVSRFLKSASMLREKNIDVWMLLSPDDSSASKYVLSSEMLQKSNQVGFSWWCNARTPDDIDFFLQLSKETHQFLFKNRISRQWMWPLCDMIYYTLNHRYGNASAVRYWIKDKRQQGTWIKTEQRVYDMFLSVIGGQEILDDLMLALISSGQEN